MADIHVEENLLKASEDDITAQESKNHKNKEASRISPNVATLELEKCNSNASLTYAIPESGRKLGSENLNNVINSVVSMNMDTANDGNETNNDVPAKEPKTSDVQKNVEPDVGTSLGQPNNPNNFTITNGDKNVSSETTPAEEVNSENTTVNTHFEGNEESKEESKENLEEDGFVDKNKDEDMIDVDNLDSEEIPLENTVGESVAKRLRSNKGKFVALITSTPKKAASKNLCVPESPMTRDKSVGIGPKKAWSKVKVNIGTGSSRKRKVISSIESKYDVGKDDPNIIIHITKRSAVKRKVQTIENVPIDKVSFHLPENAQRWKFIFHRRLALERELGKEVVKMADVMDMIKEARMLKTVCNLRNFYEKLVKEFLVNISEECDNPLSQEYQRVYVRGECVHLSPNIINKFLGNNEPDIVESKATENQVCKEITANHVKVWPKKGKISFAKLLVKYVILNWIAAIKWVPTTHSSDVATGLGKFIYLVGTETKMNIGKYVFEQIVKHAKTNVVKCPIAFPTLICGIMLDQHPSLIIAADIPDKRESPLTLHPKFFSANHVPNIVGTSGCEVSHCIPYLAMLYYVRSTP